MADLSKFINPTQPDQLRNATVLLYLNVIFALLSFNFLYLLIGIISGAGGYGIAQEKRWGYWLGIAAGVIPAILLLNVILWGVVQIGLNLFVQVAFIAVLLFLLLNEVSRKYQSTHFK